MLAYAHPILGGLTLLLLFYVGSLGLRARSDRRRAARYLSLHARLAPYMYVVILASWVFGLASTYWLRHDLELGASPHLRIGAALTGVLTAGWLTSSRMHRAEIRNTLHPLLGAAALLLGAAQVFFGLQITP